MYESISRFAHAVRPRVLLWLAVALVSWTWPARPAAAEPVSGLPTAKPCRPGSAPHEEASRALMALDAQIPALAPDGDPRAANAALAALLDHSCMRLAKGDGLEQREADSALALVHFWKQGGAEWLQSHLDMAREPEDGGRVHIVPAAMRTTLAKETHGAHPLAPLLCSLVDTDCGARTRGWALRAEQAFERFAQDREARRAANADAANDRTRTCAQRARRRPPDQRYSIWRSCIERRSHELEALPLGNLDAPTRGWLVIRGRRGHYIFCDELRAYDLTTGAAFVAQSCNAPALVESGAVDHAQTDTNRAIKAYAGQVPLANLREAAWMTLLVPFVDGPAVRTTTSHDIPAHITPKRPGGMPGSRWGDHVGSSAQTTLAWTYVHEGTVLATGTLTWPNDYNDAAREHAVRLLEIAEAGLVRGCPRSVPPAGLLSASLLGVNPGVSGLDASRDSLEHAADQLTDAMQRLRGHQTIERLRHGDCYHHRRTRSAQ